MITAVRRAWPWALAAALVVIGVVLVATGGAALYSVVSASYEPAPVGGVVPGPFIIDDQQLYGALVVLAGLLLLAGLTGHRLGARR